MIPKIIFECTSINCPAFGKEVLLTDTESIYGYDRCRECHMEGNIRISHKGIEADSIKDFYSVVNQMVREYHLLKKLIDRGLQDEEAKQRFDELSGQLDELECTFCGQKVLEHKD